MRFIESRPRALRVLWLASAILFTVCLPFRATYSYVHRDLRGSTRVERTRIEWGFVFSPPSGPVEIGMVLPVWGCLLSVGGGYGFANTPP
jgi:hypothetical protein